MKTKRWKLALALAVCAASLGAQAQGIRPSYSFPAGRTGGVEMGDSGVFATPYIGAGVGHDDNLFLTHDNPRGSTIGTISPGLRLDARTEASIIQFNYQAQIGKYSDSHDDDYVDQTSRFQSDTAFSRRSFLRVGLEYDRLHDPRGSTDRPFSSAPDKYEQFTPSATYAFGAPGAEGRIELYTSDMRRRYLNNREFTATSDRDVPEYGGAFYWRAMPKTYLLFEGRRDLIRYDISNPVSGHEDRFFVGASWEATAATTGIFKVGRMERKFDSDLPSESFTVWEGDILWTPRTYSSFDFFTVRSTNESTGVGTFILSSIGGVTWNHAWSSYVTSQVTARYQKDEFQGANRTDETSSLGLKIGYRFRPWLTLGAEYTYTHRDSNQSIYQYDRNLYLITATSSL